MKIPYGKHTITEEDIDAVAEVLRSDWLTQGPKIEEFEKDFANYIGAPFAIAVSNGTAALHLSVLALGLKPGEKVITTPITFAASANCIRYADGEVVFADIDPDTYLIDLNSVRKILNSEPSGTVKGIIPVDFSGRAVNLEKLREIADEYQCWILEDACHAPGGFFIDSLGNSQSCGNGKFADASVFSFHPVKHIAAGEGGMITTSNENLYHKIRQLRTHGIQQRQELKREDHGIWYYEMQNLGFNYRLTDIQAALAISQLKKADKGLQRRKEIAKRYNDFFTGQSYILGHSQYYDEHAYHLYIIEIEERKGLLEYLREQQIFPQVHYIPVHLMPYYQDLGWKKGDFPNAENYYSHCLSLPIYPGLTDSEQSFVIDSIKKYFERK